MKESGPAEVIEIKRKPPFWSVKIGGSYQASFSGRTARAKAIAFAVKKFRTFALIEKPTKKRVKPAEPDA